MRTQLKLSVQLTLIKDKTERTFLFEFLSFEPVAQKCREHRPTMNEQILKITQLLAKLNFEAAVKAFPPKLYKIRTVDISYKICSILNLVSAYTSPWDLVDQCCLAEAMQENFDEALGNIHCILRGYFLSGSFT